MMLILHILAISGSFLLAFVTLFSPFWPRLQKIDGPSESLLPPLFIIISTSWFLGFGIRAAIGMIGFFLEISILNVIFVTALIGGIGWGLFLFWIKQRKFHSITLNRFANGIPSFQFNPKEKGLLGIITITIGTYGYMAIAPAYTWDSIILYITSSKYIANGWELSNLIGSNVFEWHGDLLSEIIGAQSWYIVSDTYFTLGLRWLNLLFCTLVIFSLFRLLNVSRLWSLMGIEIFLLTPELVMGNAVSTKPDNLVMTLELTALVLLILTFIPMFSRPLPAKIDNHLPFISVSAILAFIAFGSRISSIYFAALTSLAYIILILKESKKNKIQLGHFFILLATWACFGLAYFNSLYEFGNPLYPFKSPWPFNNGEFQITLDSHQELQNLRAFPSIINPLYMIFHLGLGIEFIGYKLSQLGYDFLPHAASYGILNSIGWLSPMIIGIYVAPFFFKEKKIIIFITGIFLYWFTFWYNGIHLTRVFFAGGSVPIFIVSIIASLDKNQLSHLQVFLQKLIRWGFYIIIVIFIPYHMYKAIAFPHNIASLYNKEARYEATISFLQQSLPDHQFKYPSYEDAKAISKLISSLPDPVVASDLTRGLNILFDSGLFVAIEEWSSADCVFLGVPLIKTNVNKKQIHDSFSHVLFENKNWELRCLNNL